MEERNDTTHESSENTGSESHDRTPSSGSVPVKPESVFHGIKEFVLGNYLYVLIGIILVSALLSVLAPLDQPAAPPLNATLSATGNLTRQPETQPKAEPVTLPNSDAPHALNTLPPEPEPLPSGLRLPASGNNTVFEEYSGDELEDKVKQADYALFEAMKSGDIGPDRLDLRKVEIRRYNGRDFHYQSIAIHPDDADKFMADFKPRLAARVPDSAVVRTGKHDYLLSLDGHATHELRISPPEPGRNGTAPKPYEPPKQLVPGPKIALVIDDMGESVTFAENLAGLPFPVAFSIWPYSSNRKKVAHIGSESGNDILLHQPMQPKGWPKVRPGKGSLYTNMTRDDIQAMVKKNIIRIPGAQGVNNHMGSKFTEWNAGMNAALDAVNSKGMFFLDSRTTSKSAARAAAKKTGTPLYRRNIFLDNVAEVDAVIHQLRKTERIALTKGAAIAIGHPHAATLKALIKWADERDTRVSVVSLTSLKPE